jgi:hypothetical protein
MGIGDFKSLRSCFRTREPSYASNDSQETKTRVPAVVSDTEGAEPKLGEETVLKPPDLDISHNDGKQPHQASMTCAPRILASEKDKTYPYNRIAEPKQCEPPFVRLA